MTVSSPVRNPGPSGNAEVSDLPAASASARAVFGDRLPLAERYAELLADEATLRGLIGPREVPRLWERHLLNCAVTSEMMPINSTVCDVGSGAGLPGIVLAIRRPDLQVTLVEPLLRRTTFLDHVVSTMELSNVLVLRGRAEELLGASPFNLAERFDVVTSRAVAPMSRLAQWSLPLVRPDGLFLAVKGASVRAELSTAEQVITALGGGRPSVVTLGARWLDVPVTVVRVPKSGHAR